jgi:CRISPR-associated protein Csc1
MPRNQNEQLNLLTKTESPAINFQKARLIELWCAEPIFFASRELSDCYYTEGVIGNYALAYALGWARSPYRLTGTSTGKPTYREDLTPLAHDCYVLPAWSAEGNVKYRFERFNALSDSYWYAMTNNRVATSRQDIHAVRRGEKPSTFRPSNFPQTGKLRLIDRGNCFHTLILGDRELPEYIRVGKFMSKVRVRIIDEYAISYLPDGEHSYHGLLNTADIPQNLALLSFDLLSIPPVSLIKNAVFQGAAWRMGNYTIPANSSFLGGSA